MNSMELMKIGRRSLVARLNEDGSVNEYVVCSYYDGTQWAWGHYFGKDLTAAVNYINDPYSAKRHEVAMNIAHYCYFVGSAKTLGGNYIFEITDLEQRFGVTIDKEMEQDIFAELFSNPYVLEVWGTEETGDNVIDITFSTIFTEEEE